MKFKQNKFPSIISTSSSICDLIVIIILGIITGILAVHYDILERIVQITRKYEKWEIDELITLAIYLMVALAFFSLRRWYELMKSEEKLKKTNEKLENTLNEVKQLRGIIPICAACKKIRDDKGYWHQVETYIRNHTDVEFTHGVCPECMRKIFPDYQQREQ